MKALVISTLSLFILIGVWTDFYQYSNQTLQQLIEQCENEVMPALEDEDWSQAYLLFSAQYDHWQIYQRKALYILESESINEINAAFSKTVQYIKAKDYSNSSGELLALQESLKAMRHREKVTISNIL